MVKRSAFCGGRGQRGEHQQNERVDTPYMGLNIRCSLALRVAADVATLLQMVSDSSNSVRKVIYLLVSFVAVGLDGGREGH